MKEMKTSRFLKSLSCFLVVLLLISAFAGCSGRKKKPVCPPVRTASLFSDLLFVKDYTLDTAPAASVAIARVEITEWLREEGKNSFSRAKVVRCYKGELPEEITLAQYSSSTFTCRKYPVFTAGNSFLLFLIQDDRFPQETIYSILNEYATVMDIVSYDQKEYLLSRQPYFFLNTKSLPQTEDPVLLSNLLLSLQESDPIWCEIKYETKSAALLTDVENYIEKEGCDTNVE